MILGSVHTGEAGMKARIDKVKCVLMLGHLLRCLAIVVSLSCSMSSHITI